MTKSLMAGESGSPASDRAVKSTKVVILLLLGFLVATLSGLSAAPASAMGDNQAQTVLSTEVHSKVSSNEYEMEGGGTIKGSQLLTKNETGQYDIDKQEYKKLNSKGRDAFATDVVDASNEAVENGEKTGVTEETQAKWLKDLQKNPGFGSKVLNQTLKNTGPDFVTANQIYEPFSGFFSTVLGLGAILIMVLLGITIMMDIFYITVPLFRLIAGDSGGGGGGMNGSDGGGAKVGSKLVSHQARNAVEAAENSGGDGKQKSALGQYMKGKIFELFLVGLALVYLIQGQIYVAVGMFLDLMNGFLGF